MFAVRISPLKTQHLHRGWFYVCTVRPTTGNRTGISRFGNSYCYSRFWRLWNHWATVSVWSDRTNLYCFEMDCQQAVVSSHPRFGPPACKHVNMNAILWPKMQVQHERFRNFQNFFDLSNLVFGFQVSDFRFMFCWYWNVWILTVFNFCKFWINSN